MVIATRSRNAKKHPGTVDSDAPAVRRTTQAADVQASKKKKELENKKKSTKKQKAQKEMNVIEHEMAPAERKRQKDRSKERPLANEACSAGRASSRPESPSPPSRSRTANSRKATNTRKRKGQSTDQPRTPVPSCSEASSSHHCNTRSAPTDDNEERSEASGDDKSEVISAKQRKITQSNVDRPLRSSSVSALAKRREKESMTKTAGR